ncbi:MAG: ABC transporter permease subunit [Nitrososphaerota archaeon]|nr:ABC transporter permease [Candidatus Bathyarchaeota archaeon]MDW8062038.1 ABC transporter permease subunit [Nitrososphaerota archaeon]
MPSVSTVASREFSDIVRSKRFIILVAVFSIVFMVGIASIYLTVLSTARGLGIAMPTGFIGRAASVVASSISYFAPIIGIALGCDAISGEREKGTLRTVLAQPIYRDTFITGKFLAAFLAVSIAVSIASLVNVGGSMVILGVTPTGEDMVRLALFVAFSILYAVSYYGIAILLSTVARRTTQSVIVSVTLWAIFTFAIPIIASLVAYMYRPITSIEIMGRPGRNATNIRPSPEEMQRIMEQIRARAAITEAINSITPNHHFTKIAQYILGIPGSIMQSRPDLSIYQGLASAWPHTLVLVLVACITLIASYMIFVRQEVR